MTDSGFRKISLPTDLTNRAENIVKDKRLKLGYLTVTDLVRTAVHIHLNNLETRQMYLNYKSKEGDS